MGKDRKTPHSSKLKYPIEFKRLVVKYANEHGRENASKEFGVPRETLRYWINGVIIDAEKDPGTHLNPDNLKQILPVEEQAAKMEESKGLRRMKNVENRDLDEEKQFHLETLRRLAQRKTINFKDFDDVVENTENYFDACFRAGVVPSIMGLAIRGYGMSSSHLKEYLDRNNDESTRYIRRALDLIADIITDNGYKDVKAITMGIFQLKNHYGHADKVEVQTTVKHEEEMSIEDISKRYSAKGEILEPMKDITPDTES